ncbi:hypothetical protein OSB04_015662 [Centaurea solstitialis]|uniref:Uncharacterized protein n=1 Tax=Centaurea solstitialis TaxID=347529 RepID=A0AA38W7P9_9ASTR|nr:hypothetical protein OSB04_015662 [Centaurea solstitialis]
MDHPVYLISVDLQLRLIQGWRSLLTLLAILPFSLDKEIHLTMAPNVCDLQSYLSDLSLFLAPESKTFYVLVDNRPWLEDLVSGPAQLWQLMVTKSRMSPFAIRRGPKGGKEDPDYSELNCCSDASNWTKLKKWFSMTTLSRKRALLPVKKLRTSLIANSQLHRTLYGFIVFEVGWKDVRGINYLNELQQTATSLAIEARYMRRWEFDSIAQAATAITSWFPGTPYERVLLEQQLNSMLGEVVHSTDSSSFCSTSDDGFDVYAEDEYLCSPSSSLGDQSENLEDQTSVSLTPSPDGPYKRKNSQDTDVDRDLYTEMSYSGTASCQIPSPCPSECEGMTEAIQYRDVLLLFRFNDRDLPFELRKIVMADLRLLTLLEAGLPSWVIFFQSYPVFSHIYRPWMCPLARGLYVAISLFTVVIGFYDLYKNVPVLKATASRMFGPLFDWIETWEMVSRIKYLGTMLFLHNAEKAVMWFFMVTRTVRSLFSVLTQPLIAPFLVVLDALFPFWNFFIEMGENLQSLICVILETSWNLLEDLIEILLLPVWYISSVICSFAATVMLPIFWFLWGIICAPIQLVMGLSKFMGFIFKYIYDLVGVIWLFVSSLIKVTSNAEVAVHTYEVSMWRALWNDLFSQIFRAIKSILYGIVAFFAACNRHRLSIYNHLLEFIRRPYRPAEIPEPVISNNKVHRSGSRTPPGSSTGKALDLFSGGEQFMSPQGHYRVYLAVNFRVPWD